MTEHRAGALGMIGAVIMALSVAGLIFVWVFAAIWLSPDFHLSDLVDPEMAPLYQVVAIAFLLGLVLLIVDRVYDLK